MKGYIYTMLGILLLLAVSCDNTEDVLENKIDFSSPYVINDDADDPIQHHRYLIYEKYGVPVFFNDTVSETFIGMDYDGKPIYRYETLDFNWSFSSHNKSSVTYLYDYMTDAELQEKALQFVDEFLKEASRPMRPFSIFLPESFTIKNSNGVTTAPQFWNGFRTLVIPTVHNVEEAQIPSFTHMVLQSMVKDQVMNSETVSAAFGEVSGTNNYDKLWVDDLKCQWGVEHKGMLWDPADLFARGVELSYITQSWVTNVSTRAEFYAERDLIFREIGNLGFICGNIAETKGHLYSPKNVSEDMEFYLDNMLGLGREAFEARYCSSSLVIEKYTILADYINDVLGVQF